VLDFSRVIARIAVPVYFVSLSVWVGGMAILALLVAPLAFQELPSRAQAGAYFGRVLAVFSWVEGICAAVCLLSAILVQFRNRPLEKWAKVQLISLGLMIVIAATHDLHVAPQARAIRAQAGGVMESAPATEQARFASFHRASEILFGLNLLLGIVLAAISFRAFHPPPTRSD